MRSPNLVLAHPVELADRVTRFGDAEKVADPAEEPSAELARGSGDTKERHQSLGVARKQLVHRRIAGNVAAPSEDFRDEADFAFMGGGKDKIVSQPTTFIEEMDQGSGQRFNAALGIMTVEDNIRRLRQLGICARRPAGTRKLAPEPCGNGMDKMRGTWFGPIVERDEALAEPVATPAPR